MIGRCEIVKTEISLKKPLWFFQNSIFKGNQKQNWNKFFFPKDCKAKFSIVGLECQFISMRKNVSSFYFFSNP